MTYLLTTILRFFFVCHAPAEVAKQVGSPLEPLSSSSQQGGSSESESSLAGIGRDGDATPIVRIKPKYPMAAQRKGTEGWVRLSFSINEVGGVEDIVVLEAKPKRVFDRSAKRALKRWKYRAAMVEGKAIKQTRLSIQLDFTME